MKYGYSFTVANGHIEFLAVETAKRPERVILHWKHAIMRAKELLPEFVPEKYTEWSSKYKYDDDDEEEEEESAVIAPPQDLTKVSDDIRQKDHEGSRSRHPYGNKRLIIASVIATLCLSIIHRTQDDAAFSSTIYGACWIALLLVLLWIDRRPHSQISARKRTNITNVIPPSVSIEANGDSDDGAAQSDLIRSVPSPKRKRSVRHRRFPGFSMKCRMESKGMVPANSKLIAEKIGDEVSSNMMVDVDSSDVATKSRSDGTEGGLERKTIGPRDSISIQQSYYSPTDGRDVRLRIGPNYKKNGKKDFGKPAMYSCVACDFISPNAGEAQFANIGSLLRDEGLFEFAEHAEVARTHEDVGDACGGSSKLVEIALPRIIIVQLIVPKDPPMLWGGDHDDALSSQSLVMCFHIKADTIREILRDKNATPAVRLLSRFAREAANEKSSFVRSRFKTVFKLPPEDFEKLGISMAEGYNGKPIMLRKTIRVHVSPPKVCGRNRFMYDYMEIDIHVTRWDYLKKYLFSKMRPAIEDVQVLIGFLIEGVSDDELPERLFGAVRLNRLNVAHSICFP